MEAEKSETQSDTVEEGNREEGGRETRISRASQGHTFLCFPSPASQASAQPIHVVCHFFAIEGIPDLLLLFSFTLLCARLGILMREKQHI